MTAREYVDAYAAALGVTPPTDEQVEAILRLAGEAAHASERTAAPVTCWIAAAAGRDVDDALAVARTIVPGGGTA